MWRGEDKGRQHQRGPDQHAADGRHQRLVRQLGTGEVARHHAHAEQRQHHRDAAGRQMGHFEHGRLDIAEHGEQAAEANGADAERQPDLLARQRAQLPQRAGVAVRRHEGHPGQHQQHRQHANGAHDHKGRAPAEPCTDGGGNRHPDQRGDGQPQHHQPHGLGPFLARDQPGGHQRGHAEVGAMRETGHQPRDDHRRIGRRQRAGEVAGGEERHQRDQQVAARPARAEHGQQRRADHHAQRVGADQVAGFGNRDGQVAGGVGQQAHDDEFAGADAEAAHAQCQQRAAVGRAVAGGGGV
ncbi:hypothetical protein D3C87_1248810 [compost metagenome]